MMSSGTRFLRTITQISAALMLLLITGAPQQARAQRGRGFTLPENVATRSVTFWSEGTRLAGDLYYPKDMNEDSNLPAIVLCHGWGGTKSGLRRLGSDFAAAGYVVLAFDYRGWGASDGKVVVKGELPKERTEVTVLVQVIREVVDPFDQLWDIRHAIDFIETEPGVDADRIGIWGSSYGGGLVVWTAAHDERVKCVASQVGAQDSRSLGNAEARDSMHQRALQIARGEIEPFP
ncbi:alpha/beta fold hydrolase, partial [Candidatus Sumerlaeota bacterium]|nr:alpha/beta fold hydrolase [Candidatus Sumerlaeota bacterium]